MHDTSWVQGATATPDKAQHAARLQVALDLLPGCVMKS
jgi:hypothetical protein